MSITLEKLRGNSELQQGNYDYLLEKFGTKTMEAIASSDDPIWLLAVLTSTQEKFVKQDDEPLLVKSFSKEIANEAFNKCRDKHEDGSVGVFLSFRDGWDSAIEWVLNRK